MIELEVRWKAKCGCDLKYCQPIAPKEYEMHLLIGYKRAIDFVRESIDAVKCEKHKERM